MARTTKPRKPRRARYLVVRDYAAKDLRGSGAVDEKTGELIYDGKGGVHWTAGAVVELDTADAAWVNDQQPGTLEDHTEPDDPAKPDGVEVTDE